MTRMKWLVTSLAGILLSVILIACSQYITNTPPQITTISTRQTNQPDLELSFSLQSAANISSPISAILWLDESLAFADADQIGLIEIPISSQPQSLQDIQSLEVGEYPIHLSSNQLRNQIGWVSNESEINVWKVNELSDPIKVANPDLPVTSIAINPNGDELAFSSLDGKIERRSLTPGVQSVAEWSVPDWLSNLSYAPDGSKIGGADLARFVVYIFSLDGALLSTIEWGGSPSSVLYGAYFSPDWSTLAWVSGSAVQLTDLDARQETHLLTHEDAVTAAAWSPVGSLLATSSAANMEGNPSPAVFIWDSSTGEQVEAYLLDSPAQSLTFSPDGRKISILDANGSISIYNLH